MEKIIPFKKDIIFKTNVSEITSISLEHNLTQKDKFLVNGTFTISGEYKMADDSVILDSFSYELPFDINIDDRYDTDKLKIDIDDFYYEIINDNVLSVSIDVLLANLEELPKTELEELEVIDTEEEEIEDREKMEEQVIDSNKISEEVIEEREVEKDSESLESVISEEKQEEIPLEKEEQRCIEEEGISLFDNLDTVETYQSYKVYIVREGDTLDKILETYQITRDDLACYNDLSEIKINDKIIIPASSHETV